MAKDGGPIGIDAKRHRDLAGRSKHVWQRRVGLLVLTAIPVLGLFNVFGQRTHFTRANTQQAALLVDSPAHVRGGLIFTTQIVITPHQQLRDARLLLDYGWFKAMTFNAISPQPSNEWSSGKWQVLDYGQLPAGIPYHIWVSWQTNPTNIGRHPQDVALFDGGSQIMVVRRTITVFP